MSKVTNFLEYQCLDADITTNTTTAGEIIDCQDLLDISFTIQAPTVSAGNFALLIQDGDESDLSDAATCSYVTWTSSPSLSAATVDGGLLSRQGLSYNKRYVRASVVSTGVSGTNHVVVNMRGRSILRPTAQ